MWTKDLWVDATRLLIRVGSPVVAMNLKQDRFVVHLVDGDVADTLVHHLLIHRGGSIAFCLAWHGCTELAFAISAIDIDRDFLVGRPERQFIWLGKRALFWSTGVIGLS